MIDPDDDNSEPANIAGPRTIHSFGSKEEYIPPKWGREAAFVPSRTPFKADLTERSGEAATAAEA